MVLLSRIRNTLEREWAVVAVAVLLFAAAFAAGSGVRFAAALALGCLLLAVRVPAGLPDLIVRVGRDGACLGYAGGAGVLPSGNPAAFIVEITAGAAQHLGRAFETREVQTYECRIVLDGAARDYEVRITADGPDEALLIVREFTGRAAAQAEALRQAKESLEAIAGNAPLAIYATGLDGRVKSWNAAAEQMFGWTEQEALNARVPFIAAEDLDAFYAGLDPAQDGALAGVEARAIRKDGTAAELMVWRTPLREASGPVNGFLTIAADITERKSLERQLQQSQKMEAVGRLAGGVAHDFNNLLTVITGYGYMLLEDLEDQPSARGNVDEILRAVERASSLTNQLLAFSRRQVAQPKAIDVNELVLDMDKMLRRVIGEHIELVTALCPDAGTINADPGQIEQMIMNLVVNSRDAMPEGGRITIETANATLDEEYARIHLTVRPGEYVMLSVIDTGHGMDEHTRAHIFEPFFTTKEQGKGTGLGLAQVYGIVKQTDGEITVTSAPEQGTRFQIYLPRIFGTAPAGDEAETDGYRAEGTETVLLVEDEDDVRRLVCEVLEQHGYTVLPAAQPQDAIEICRTHRGRIELLLTDVVMPQMGGRELAERTGWIRPDMKVLFMSGYTEDAMLGVSITEPGVAFLKKPFTPAVLTRKIRDVLEATQGLSAAAE